MCRLYVSIAEKPCVNFRPIFSQQSTCHLNPVKASTSAASIASISASLQACPRQTTKSNSKSCSILMSSTGCRGSIVLITDGGDDDVILWALHASQLLRKRFQNLRPSRYLRGGISAFKRVFPGLFSPPITLSLPACVLSRNHASANLATSPDRRSENLEKSNLGATTHPAVRACISALHVSLLLHALPPNA